MMPLFALWEIVIIQSPFSYNITTGIKESKLDLLIF